MRKPILTAVAVLTATVLAACGGVDENAYVEQVTKVQQATQTDAQDLSAKMASATTPKAIGANLEALGQAVEKNAVKLDAIEAPEKVAEQHQQYVDLMNKFGKDLEALATKVSKATASNVSTILADASKLTSGLASGESKIVNEINTELQS